MAFIKKDYWRKFGEQALSSFFEYVFNNFPVIKVEKWVFEFDHIAQEILEKFADRKDTVYPKIVFKANRYHDIIVYTFSRENWQKKFEIKK